MNIVISNMQQGWPKLKGCKIFIWGEAQEAPVYANINVHGGAQTDNYDHSSSALATRGLDIAGFFLLFGFC